MAATSFKDAARQFLNYLRRDDRNLFHKVIILCHTVQEKDSETHYKSGAAITGYKLPASELWLLTLMPLTLRGECLQFTKLFFAITNSTYMEWTILKYLNTYHLAVSLLHFPEKHFLKNTFLLQREKLLHFNSAIKLLIMLWMDKNGSQWTYATVWNIPQRIWPNWPTIHPYTITNVLYSCNYWLHNKYTLTGNKKQNMN